jgi:acetyl-CoA synthetase
MARDDDVIIMAGYRIGPFDVESIIAPHPDVQECAVVAVPDEMKGEVIEAFVVLRAKVDDEDAVADELKQRRDNLAARTAVGPLRRFLPKTPSGKIQRYVLVTSAAPSSPRLAMLTAISSSRTTPTGSAPWS